MDDSRPCPDISDCRKDSLASQRHSLNLYNRDPFANEKMYAPTEIMPNHSSKQKQMFKKKKQVYKMSALTGQDLYIPKKNQQESF